MVGRQVNMAHRSTRSSSLSLLCGAILLGMQLTVGAARRTASADADWITRIIQEVQKEDVNTRATAGEAALATYPEGSVPAFLQSHPLMQPFAPVFERLGLTEWETLEGSYGDADTQQDTALALGACSKLLREARRRKMQSEAGSAGRRDRAASRHGALRGGGAEGGAGEGARGTPPSPEAPLGAPPPPPGGAGLPAWEEEPREDGSGSPLARYDPLKHYDPAEELPVGAKWKRQLAAEPAILEIKGLESLAEAADRVNDRGRVLLLTTRGPEWALTALNAVHFLGVRGFHGVLAVLSSLKECKEYIKQRAVPVPTCVWVNLDYDQAHKHSWPGNRMLWLEQLARLGYQVLMADTDICYEKDPFPVLEKTGATVVTSGKRLDTFNLGVMYANGRNSQGTHDLGLLTEMNRRMRILKEEWKAKEGLICKDALNDQNMVNDVVQEWVSKRAMYHRSCSLARKDGKMPEGTCFAQCCSPLQQEYYHNDTAFKAVIKADMAAYHRNRRDILVELSSLGHCNSPFGVVHMNTCQTPPNPIGDGEEGYTRDDPRIAGQHSHFQWLRENCWAPGLTEVARAMITGCKTEQCKEAHPDGFPNESDLDHDRSVFDSM